jgi:hypothetical protein
MSPREIAEDLDYVRTLAEEGRHAPLLGGSFLIFWGLLNATAWGIQWGLVNRLLVADPDWHFAALWMAYGIAAGVGSSILGARVRALPGRSSLGNRVESAAWAGSGIGTGAVVVGAIGHMVLGGGGPTAPDVIMPAAFALYGSALLITSIVSKEKWLGWAAAGSFVLASILGIYLSAPWFYLVGALGALATLLAPGLVLLRKEPSTTV